MNNMFNENTFGSFEMFGNFKHISLLQEYSIPAQPKWDGYVHKKCFVLHRINACVE